MLSTSISYLDKSGVFFKGNVPLFILLFSDFKVIEMFLNALILGPSINHNKCRHLTLAFEISIH
jgi:hypothetical protein